MSVKMNPIISKAYCSSSPVIMVVRRRPKVVGGGGFLVMDCGQKVVFRVEGCGTLGKKEELVLSDGNGDALLLIRRKGGLVEALSIQKQWKGYTFNFNFERSQKSVFCLKEPNSCFLNNQPIRISVDNYRDFEIRGSFLDRDCSIVDNQGNVIAQVGVKDEVMASNDLYHVVVKPGIDQAFVFGVIAVLDYIHDGSTRC